MEKVKKAKRHKRHIIRNLPLKWSFMLYVLVCALIAILLSISAAAYFSNLQSDLYYEYHDAYLKSHGLSEDDIVDGVLKSDESIVIYRIINNMLMSSEDSARYDAYGYLALFSVPIIALLCIVLTGIIFYNRKLREPLRLIDASSARIAAGDLDFSIAYPNRNEMGRLAASFETMRAALQDNQREMWRMMEQRGQLNAAFAHDLRTPLTVLKGYTEYLTTYVPQKRVPEEKLLDTLGLMHAYVTRLEGYTASMSAMQRLEEVHPAPQALAFDALSRRLHAAAEMLRGVYHLRFSAEGDGMLSMDPDLITQVLENLVANAARYAAKEIEVSILKADETITLTVSDDGPGFPAKILRRGIVPYNQNKEEAQGQEHYGLGLYICSVLCARHGGALTLPEAEGSSRVTATFAALPVR